MGKWGSPGSWSGGSSISTVGTLETGTEKEEVGADDARIGLPCNLFPIHEQDHILARILNQINQLLKPIPMVVLAPGRLLTISEH